MSRYFPPYGGSSESIKVELDLSNYATKTDVKNITHVDVISFASKTNLAALKSEVDKIDTDKLKTVPDDLAKLSNVVKNDVVKKTDCNSKIMQIETSTQNTLKYTLDNLADIKKLKQSAPDISTLATKSSLSAYLQTTTFNSKVTELENKIPSITNLATKTEVEGKIPDVTGYVKKTDYATEITAIKNDYATNESIDSKINYLKAQHIADEV